MNFDVLNSDMTFKVPYYGFSNIPFPVMFHIAVWECKHSAKL